MFKPAGLSIMRSTLREGYMHLVQLIENTDRRRHNKNLVGKLGFTPSCYLERESDHINLVLHSTDILRMFPNGEFELRCDGWYTPTTNHYMGEATAAWCRRSLTVHEYRRNLWSPKVHILQTHGEVLSQFYDGIRFDKEGNLISERRVWKDRVLNRKRANAAVRPYKKQFDMLLSVDKFDTRHWTDKQPKTPSGSMDHTLHRLLTEEISDDLVRTVIWYGNGTMSAAIQKLRTHIYERTPEVFDEVDPTCLASEQ